MKERYINPFTGFAFKKVFGEEANKEDILEKLLKIDLYDEVERQNYRDSLKYY